MNVDIIPYGTCHELELCVYDAYIYKYLEELEHCCIVQNECMREYYICSEFCGFINNLHKYCPSWLCSDYVFDDILFGLS